MKIIAIEHDQPDASGSDFVPHLKAEAARAWELYQQGAIRELYFRSDTPSAILILECPDMKAAQAALDTLPLVQAGLIAFELIPLKAYPGFARLFDAAYTTGEGHH